jgi:16S rRNA (cytidine1402-2'-O)-methyltransferase
MLYITGLPIGNAEDMSMRVARLITSASLVLAEDTRSFAHLQQKACELFTLSKNSDQQVWSYYKEVEFAKLHEIVALLEAGADIVLVSEAGMPLISDPGQLLISTARKRGIPVTVIPGPSSVDTALCLSGLPHRQFLFLGFLPKKQGELTKLAHKLMIIADTLPDTVFLAFDSPLRIREDIECLSATLPQATFSIARELTKPYEDYVTVGPATDWKQIKGECVILITFKT